MDIVRDMLVHLPIALIIMLACWRLGRRMGVATAPAIWLGWFAGACACITREVTQHEYRWIETAGQGRRAGMAVLEGLRVWDWNSHSLIETVGALVISALVALAIARWV